MEYGLLTILARRGRIALIRTLKSFPDRQFSINELARVAGVPTMTTWRAVEELRSAKIAKVRKIGNVRSVRITDDASVLRTLRLVEDTDPQKAAAKGFADRISVHGWAVECRLFGSVARGEHMLGEEVDIAVVFDDKEVSEEDAKSEAKAISDEIRGSTNVSVVPLTMSMKDMSRRGGLASELRDKEIIWSRRK
jgi:predicted nucleotidyltransferase